MPAPDPRPLAATLELTHEGLAQADGLFVLGIVGAQGSGKSTLAQALVRALASDGIAAALLSLDDLYLTRRERECLSREVHPLLLTRGVPGTHDIALGLDVLAALDRGEAAPLPRFDKARDDRLPAADWPLAPAQCRVLVLEGWCLGARAEPDAALAEPVNSLERDEDPRGQWRGYANAALAGDYQRLFTRIDRLVMLAAPDFAVVRRWRSEQEAEIRDHPGAMDEAAIARFVLHYERVTRHMLREMPARADLLVRLDARRRPLAIVRQEPRAVR